MSDTPQQFRLREVCRWMLGAGVKPTPTRLAEVEGSFVRRRGVNITLSHGRLANARAETLAEYGWRFNDNTKRWEPPVA